MNLDVLKEIMKQFVLVIIVTISLMFIINYCNPKDSTDPTDGRSGFRLMKDNLTGCQYLQAGYFGGITPRIDGNGNHICK